MKMEGVGVGVECLSGGRNEVVRERRGWGRGINHIGTSEGNFLVEPFCKPVLQHPVEAGAHQAESTRG